MAEDVRTVKLSYAKLVEMSQMYEDSPQKSSHGDTGRGTACIAFT